MRIKIHTIQIGGVRAAAACRRRDQVGGNGARGGGGEDLTGTCTDGPPFSAPSPWTGCCPRRPQCRLRLQHRQQGLLQRCQRLLRYQPMPPTSRRLSRRHGLLRRRGRQKSNPAGTGAAGADKSGERLLCRSPRLVPPTAYAPALASYAANRGGFGPRAAMALGVAQKKSLTVHGPNL